MRKVVAIIAVIMLILSACGNSYDKPVKSVPDIKTRETEYEQQLTDLRKINSVGANGTIYMSLPEGWEYEICSESNSEFHDVESGIHFYPKGKKKGYVEVGYNSRFAVCGTGLEIEQVILAGDLASIGTYDNNEVWSFIWFKGKNDGVVACNIGAENWWNEYREQVLQILDTVKFVKS